MFNWLLQSGEYPGPSGEVSDFAAFGDWFAENGAEFMIALGIGIFIGIMISIIFSKITRDKEE